VYQVRRLKGGHAATQGLEISQANPADLHPLRVDAIPAGQREDHMTGLLGR
jgi:hypothetical protein